MYVLCCKYLHWFQCFQSPTSANEQFKQNKNDAILIVIVKKYTIIAFLLLVLIHSHCSLCKNQTIFGIVILLIWLKVWTHFPIEIRFIMLKNRITTFFLLSFLAILLIFILPKIAKYFLKISHWNGITLKVDCVRACQLATHYRSIVQLNLTNTWKMRWKLIRLKEITIDLPLNANGF